MKAENLHSLEKEEPHDDEMDEWCVSEGYEAQCRFVK